jgi:DNA-binding response OmpR family regulator
MPSTITVADIIYDEAKSILRNESGREAKHLGPKRGRLFAILMRSPGSRFSTDVLYERVYGDKPSATKKVIKVHVSQLRRALKTMTSTVYIDGSREGYCLKTVPPS